MDRPDLAGAVVVVNGASSGIGRATARALAAAGASPRRVMNLVDQTLARHGRIDALVNDAGAGLSGTLAEVDLDELAARLQLNVVALVRVTQAVLPTMLSREHGRIVGISSGTTRMIPTGNGACAATRPPST